ncbi:MAG TPA: PfkB family carbohydrate kinase [Spirochaetia bacterium]|nr:PfkB family carbohydrate kinase [Spirochaetia bacterium]
MTEPRRITALLRPGSLKYRGLVGTGGIGSGSFFMLAGNETLGREESRGGRFLDRRDYCKLHIICHYVKALLGDALAVIPIGRVGDDEAGATLLGDMEDAGLDLRFVRRLAGAPTLHSFCILYPDGSGGNLTTDDSASSRVDRAAVAEAGDIMRSLGGSGIALAVPEVPLDARVALLEQAGRSGLFRAASFTRAEMPEVRRRDLLAMVDLAAVNAEEALAAAGLEAADAAASAPSAIEAISRRWPKLLLSVTAGRAGSWSWDGTALRHDPAIPVPVRGTAGAGDAHCAGILGGLAAGLPLAEAQRLGTLVAAASVTSEHTINRDITTGQLLSLSATDPRRFSAVRAALDTALAGS